MAGKDDTDKKGFSGLSDLVSDISGNHEQASASSEEGTKPPLIPKATPPKPKETFPHEPNRSPTRSLAGGGPSGSGRSGESSGAKWVIGIIVGVVVFVVWLANIEDQGATKQPYNPPAPSPSYTYPQFNPSAPAAPANSNVQASTGQYVKPPVGRDNVLSVSQICWCLREDIRIESMRDVADTEASIAKFNGLVVDYNSRCGSYRYREGALKQAERSVEAHRSEIVAEAIREARQWSRLSPPSQSISAPDGGRMKRPNYRDTREAQELLTELGYKPGPIDGDYGRATSNAVRAFQLDIGMAQDGWIDENLISLLKTAKAASSSAVEVRSTGRPSVAESNSQPSTLPQTVWTPPVPARSPRSDTTDSSIPTGLSLDDQLKYSSAMRLRRLGYDVDWQTSTLSDMLDAESRIGTANRLKRLGLNVDWQTSTLSDMLDAESRIGTANRLKRLGLDVDWQTSTLSDMLDAESRIGAANRLRRKGRAVDWREYSLSQLLSIESEVTR